MIIYSNKSRGFQTTFTGYIELPQTQNRYAYCINNPLKYIDPLGLCHGYGDVYLYHKYNAFEYTFHYRGRYYFDFLPDDPGRLPLDFYGYLGKRGGNVHPPYGGSSAGDAPPGGGTYGPQYTKATEFQRIISSYANWWNINFPQHYTTAIPGIRAFQRESWSCVEWCDALEEMLKNLDLRFHTIQRLQSPSWYAPVPLFHNWIVLTSDSGFIWLDPWWFGSYFGVEFGGD